MNESTARVAACARSGRSRTGRDGQSLMARHSRQSGFSRRAQADARLRRASNFSRAERISAADSDSDSDSDSGAAPVLCRLRCSCPRNWAAGRAELRREGAKLGARQRLLDLGAAPRVNGLVPPIRIEARVEAASGSACHAATNRRSAAMRAKKGFSVAWRPRIEPEQRPVVV